MTPNMHGCMPKRRMVEGPRGSQFDISWRETMIVSSLNIVKSFTPAYEDVPVPCCDWSSGWSFMANQPNAPEIPRARPTYDRDEDCEDDVGYL